MYKNGPVIVIEDDADDQFFLQEVFTKLGYPNEIVFLRDGEAALDYLHKPEVKPFLILSDINLPKLTGFELRDKLKTDANIALQCITYLFFSTALNQRAVIDAYSHSAQGFFVKQTDLGDMETVIKVIMEYWRNCQSPNNFL